MIETYLTQIGSKLPNPDGFLDTASLTDMKETCREVAKGMKLVASYCEGKAHAMECRLAGKIELARKFEAACDEVYDKLPDWARW